MQENQVNVIDEFEDSLADMDQSQIDEFSQDVMAYDRFVVLPKKELNNFCRIVEPLTKVSNDEYGKSVFISSLDKDTVELRYVNTPYVVCYKIVNKSSKVISSFSVSVAVLKKLVTNTFASLVFVEQDGEISIAVCGSLLYVETKPLSKSFYEIPRLATSNSIDKEVAGFVFKKAGAVLSLSDRASEKVIVIKDGNAIFNTGFFVSKIKSPFGDSDNFVVWQIVASILGVLSEVTKSQFLYSIEKDNDDQYKLVVNTDGVIYCELPIGYGTKVDEFYSPVVESLLNFEASIRVVNDSIIHLISLVKSVDYLSDIVTISFDKSVMKFVVYNTSMTKPSNYEFPMIEGTPDKVGEMKLNADVLKSFLEITSLDVQYAFNNDGLGIANDHGKFLIRSNN